LLFALACCLTNSTRMVTTNPSIHTNTVPDFTTQKLPHRNSELLALDIPECNIKARQR
jgi:hypothetical protein